MVKTFLTGTLNFEMLLGSKPWLVQKSWHKMQKWLKRKIGKIERTGEVMKVFLSIFMNIPMQNWDTETQYTYFILKLLAW